MGAMLTAVGSFFATNAGEAVAAGAASAAVGTGLNALLAKSPNIKIPPPPGAAMIDPAGSAAAAATRQRQASAGGLASTIGAVSAGPTGGGKTLLGQ